MKGVIEKGSLQTKGGKYYAVFNIVKPDGKKSTKWISTGCAVPKEKKKAERFLKAKELEYDVMESSEGPEDDGLIMGSIGSSVGQAIVPVLTPTGQLMYAQNIQVQQPTETPFYSYIQTWLKRKKADSSIDVITYEQYESLCENHLVPYFKKKKCTLETINYRNIQEYIDFEAKCGNKKTKTGLSPKTIGTLKKVSSQIFKTARRDKLITDNPCEFVNVPKQIKSERNILTLEQMQKFFSCIKSEKIYPIIYITTVYGLRRSEVLGIMWDSIDYEKMTVTIKHTVVQGKKLYKKDSTKNESSHRTYPMSSEIKEIFLSLKREEEDNKKRYGKGYINNDYVFKWENGEIIKPDYLNKKLNELLKKMICLTFGFMI